MKSCYYIRLSNTAIAIADICDYYEDGMIITRINVPLVHRGRGHGSALLQMLLDDADKEGVKLWLEINASGELTHEQLELWYTRHGFKNYKGTGVYRRLPKQDHA